MKGGLLGKYWFQVLLGITMLLAAGLLLGPGGRDDAYKTFWPAETLASTGRILNYNGDAVEQSSSLLHVLLLGGLRTVVGGPIATLNLWLVLGCGCAGIALALYLARKLGLRQGALLALALGTQGCWAYWSWGGLDAVLSGTCWLLWLVVLLRTLEDVDEEQMAEATAWRAWRLAVGRSGSVWLLPMPTLLLVLARPENGLVAMAGLLLWMGADVLRAPRSVGGPALRRMGMALLAVALATAGLVMWRLWHGGHWLPQSAAAKTDGLSWTRLRSGLGYHWLETWRHLELLPLWLGLVATLVPGMRGGDRRGASLLACVALAGLGLVAAAGGDWMENARFAVPYLPILLLLLWAQLERLPARLQSPIRLLSLTAHVAGLLWIAAHFTTGYSPLFPPALPAGMEEGELPFAERHNKTHLRDAVPLQHLLALHDSIHATKGGAKVEVLSQQAGYLMYHLAQARPGETHFVDLVGLCTRDFTDCPVTRDRGRLRGGLNMDLVYLLDDWARIAGECGLQKPDIIWALDDAEGQLRNALVRHGYRIAYLQEGAMASTGLGGMEIGAGEFIAVRVE